MACTQCGQPALYLVGPEKVPLCLNCYERHDRIIQRQQEENAAMLNYLLGTMEATVGLPAGSLGPRIQIPRYQIMNQPFTFNNIHVKDSSVGVINTGQAKVIDVAVTYFQNGRDDALSNALRDFTQVVIDNNELNHEVQSKIVEQLSFLATEIAKKDKKQTSVARAVFEDLTKSIPAVKGLIDLWQKLEPLLKTYVG